MKLLLFITAILFCIQSHSQTYVKMELTTNVDTLQVPLNETRNFQITVSGERKSAIRSVTISNYNGVYSIDRNVSVESFLSFTGSKFEILLINKLPIVRITLPKIPSTDWIYKKD